MIADKFLDRLEGVRESAPDRWIAKCPAHDDGSPSLSVSDIGDKVLIHCHAGCSPYEVLDAVGLEINDLYPPRDPQTHGTGPVRRRADYKGAWLLARKAFYLLVIATADLEAGRALSEVDRKAVALARSRIYSVLGVVT